MQKSADIPGYISLRLILPRNRKVFVGGLNPNTTKGKLTYLNHRNRNFGQIFLPIWRGHWLDHSIRQVYRSRLVVRSHRQIERLRVRDDERSRNSQIGRCSLWAHYRLQKGTRLFNENRWIAEQLFPGLQSRRLHLHLHHRQNSLRRRSL